MGALGRPLRRTEDRRLITGAGRYLDDLEPPGTLHAVFVRCREANAVLGAIEIGGVAHGLGNAIMERVVHSDDAQPLVTTFVDYRIPAAEQVPPITKVHTETPSPRNPLGAKGAGEGGTLPAMAAVAAAVDDALSDLGVVVDRYPLLPETVRSMVSANSRAG